MTDALSNQFLREEFRSAFLRVWDSLIGRELSVLPDNQRFTDLRNWVAGVVWIGGMWTGSVTLAFPEAFAKDMAAQLLGLDEALLSHEHTVDMVRELTNMSAGNFKSVLPGPCGLATPGFFTLHDREGLTNQFQHVLSMDFECQNHGVIIELHSL